MRKQWVLGIILSVMGAGGNAAEYGVGASLKDNDRALYFPIYLNNGIILEPYLNHSASNFRSGDSNYSWRAEETLAGIGVFKNTEVRDKISSYLGVRFAHLDRSCKDEYRHINNDGVAETHSSEYSTEGYSIEPVLGMTYNFDPRIALSIEMAYAYQKSETNGHHQSSLSMDVNEPVVDDSTNQTTKSRVVFRYKF